ncbi:MAG: hypothetical protein K9M54_07535 [Kiritimatiellales bacterium]|nr:hypothetical protein [Kiritimatiellales bacterium]
MTGARNPLLFLFLLTWLVGGCSESDRPQPEQVVVVQPEEPAVAVPEPPVKEPEKPVVQTVAPARTGPLVCEPWLAVDGLGRDMAGAKECGPPRMGKFVGIFYFLWLGGHEQQGPYNITDILKQPEDKREWGPKNIFHWWGEPRFGYYLMDDEWVIAKHAQMLADAGVDVVVCDVTNGFTYEKNVLTLCKVYRGIRDRGGRTPQIAFLANSKAKEVTEKLYRDFYQKNLYPELWFRWKGKPLMMTNPEGLSQEILDFFAIRRSWAWSDPKGWFGDGQDKWPWIDKTPQAYGWHEDSEIPEYVSVATASHPVNSTGRSHKDGKQPPPGQQNPTIGTYFQEQWDYAFNVDPEFIFITGWNEWVAQRFVYDGKKPRQFADGTVNPGDTWFIDQFSMEYSRDIEPMRGGYEDNYYYQMVSNIRKFKGVRPIPETSTLWNNIAVDGDLADWRGVEPEYHDDLGDTCHRDHPGYASAGTYTNDWGRNDIVSCKVARGASNVYFCVETAEPLTAPGKADPSWMNLLLTIRGKDLEGWEGFQYRIVPVNPSNGMADVRVFQKGRWNKVMEIPCAMGTNGLELALPLGESGSKLQTLELDFKWIDHMPEPLDILDFQDHGDTAPNNRFRYAFKHKTENNK